MYSLVAVLFTWPKAKFLQWSWLWKRSCQETADIGLPPSLLIPSADSCSGSATLLSSTNATWWHFSVSIFPTVLKLIIRVVLYADQFEPSHDIFSPVTPRHLNFSRLTCSNSRPPGDKKAVQLPYPSAFKCLFWRKIFTSVSPSIAFHACGQRNVDDSLKTLFWSLIWVNYKLTKGEWSRLLKTLNNDIPVQEYSCTPPRVLRLAKRLIWFRSRSPGYPWNVIFYVMFRSACFVTKLRHVAEEIGNPDYG